MKMFRKFIIKYFVGRYWWKFWFQSHYNVTSRAGFWNFNGYLLLSLIFILSGGKAEWVIQIPAYLWSAFVLYFTFPLLGYSYFEIFPIKWEEMDSEQKWHYGQAVMSGELTKKISLTDEQMIQWIVLNNMFKKKYNLK